jgi:hypothetical protein
MKTIRLLAMAVLLAGTVVFLMPTKASAGTVNAVKEEDPDTCGIKCVNCGGTCAVNCCDTIIAGTY